MTALTDELKAHKRNERHLTAAESRYWCDQYRQLAERAVAAVAAATEGKQAVARIKDGSLQWYIPLTDYAVDVALLKGEHLLYTTPPAAPVPDDWRKIVEEMASEIEANVRANYPDQIRAYPTMQRAFDRDMDVVDRARAMLAAPAPSQERSRAAFAGNSDEARDELSQEERKSRPRRQ